MQYRDMTTNTLSKSVDNALNSLSEEQILATYRNASRLGIVAGLRSMLPFALLANNEEQLPYPGLKTFTALLALGEIIADKLPATPGRTRPGPLAFRLLIGAASGALICRRAQLSTSEGAIRGALGALIGSFAGYGYRTLLSESTGVPDVIFALGEDTLALVLGQKAVQKPQTPAEELA